MAAIAQYLDPEEREEWDGMLADALEKSGGQSDQTAIDFVESAIGQAERAGRLWPELLRRQWDREGMRVALVQYAKAQATVLVAHDGKLIGKTARRGVRVTAPSGRRVWQQTLFHQMTWPEFYQWRAINRNQIEALEINAGMAAKIADLHSQAPDSMGPQDACVALGTSLEEVLAAS